MCCLSLPHVLRRQSFNVTPAPPCCWGIFSRGENADDLQSRLQWDRHLARLRHGGVRTEHIAVVGQAFEVYLARTSRPIISLFLPSHSDELRLGDLHFLRRQAAQDRLQISDYHSADIAQCLRVRASTV